MITPVPAGRPIDRVGVEPAMRPAQRHIYWALGALWIAVNAFFWVWWVQVRHTSGNLVLYITVSLAMLYVFTVLPSAYLFFLGRMRLPIPIAVRRAEQKGTIRRVAVITLTVPGSESLDIVRRQMVAMKRIQYPHDSWILVDKEHSSEIELLASQMGVHYFSRHDVARWGADQVARWNQPAAPFAAKTKAGNVNSWLDAYVGQYSHFTQFDIDHNPIPAYLHKVLGYFADPAVAYVQAPSVYNNHQYWTARGSSEQELVLQGPLQMGFFGLSRTPFIIGSHCTYDTAAIQCIGGFQPTRAEDHLDTVCLAAAGYEGVYVPEVIAAGDGPEDLRTYLAQQFAWAYSMIQVLFRYTPRLVRRYTPRRALQFLFVQTWYTFWSTSMLVLFAAPLVSLTLNVTIAGVSYWIFLAHILPVSAVSCLTWLWSKAWQFPHGLRLSWRGVVLHVARWVVVLSALIQVILKVKKSYMITVKGMQDSAAPPFPLKIVAPYIALVGISLAPCWFYLVVYGGGPTQGYLFFALKGALVFLLMLAAPLLYDIHSLIRSGLILGQVLRARIAAIGTLLGVTGVFTVTAVASAGLIWTALTS